MAADSSALRRPPRRQTAPPAGPSVRERRQAAIAKAAETVQVEYIDEGGRKFRVLVPRGHEDEAAQGVVLGPPDLTGLGWPEALATALHNELYHRGIITARDARQRAAEIQTAIAVALNADLHAVQALYREGG